MVQASSTPELVAVRFNTPAKLKKGSYVLTISAAGIRDAAGNPLVETFFIPQPTLGFRPGQNFVAQINYNGKTASPPQQFLAPPAPHHPKPMPKVTHVAKRKRP